MKQIQITFLLLSWTASVTAPAKEEIPAVVEPLRAKADALPFFRGKTRAVAGIDLAKTRVAPLAHRPSANDFDFLGSFRLKAPASGTTQLRLINATIVASGGKVYCVSGSNTQWAEFTVPDTLGETLTTAPVVTMNGAWQNLTPGYTQVPDPRCYGGIMESGKFLHTVQRYYNAVSADNPCLGWGEKGLWQLEGHSQGQAGHIGRIPEPWATKHGFTHFCGLSGTPISGQSSWGPSATLFNFDFASPPATDFVIPTKKALFYPSTKPFPGWTHTDEIRGAAWTTKGLYFFGRHGVGETWYGEATSPSGKIDTCSIGTKGYHAEAHSSWVWVFNPETLEFIEEGPGPFAKPLRKNPDVPGCLVMRSASIDGDKVYVLGEDWRTRELFPNVYQNAVYVFRMK